MAGLMKTLSIKDRFFTIQHLNEKVSAIAGNNNEWRSLIPLEPTSNELAEIAADLEKCKQIEETYLKIMSKTLNHSFLKDCMTKLLQDVLGCKITITDFENISYNWDFTRFKLAFRVRKTLYEYSGSICHLWQYEQYYKLCKGERFTKYPKLEGELHIINKNYIKDDVKFWISWEQEVNNV